MKLGSTWSCLLRETGETLLPDLSLADHFFARLIGLQFRADLPLGSGLLLVPCSSVHTFFMRFPIDLIYLDRDGRILGTRPGLAPWRTAIAPKGTFAVLEVSTATGCGRFEVGRHVALVPSPTRPRIKPARLSASWFVTAFDD